MQKIKAYTLMEVTVAMLLSALTITICYSAYGIVGNYFKSFQVKNALADEVLSLRHTLDRDMERSDCILKTEEGFEFLQDSSKIIYVFTDKYIIRRLNELHTDTFKLQLKELKSFFETEEVVATDTVDQINFKLNLTKDQPVFIQSNKYYSATTLFK
jgi:type II secretory pathway component PulJ